MKACLSNSKLSRAPLESIKTTTISSPSERAKQNDGTIHIGQEYNRYSAVTADVSSGILQPTKSTFCFFSSCVYL